ncbi:MAG: biopolymer transporter ExbD [Verrucomicrobiales bacterium]|nr:biopolymer transporter ExbD [Verrucomicrobiales bacterium]
MKLESTLPSRTAPLYTAPLLDVILLLLIFFLLGSGFILKSGVAVTLPYSESSLPVAERSHIVTIVPGETERFFFNETRVTREELDARLGESTGQTRQVILLADQRVPYGTVMDVSGLILGHGYDLAYATGAAPAAP